jgi:bacillithiol biosynthesis cysteine-adding enzyme BshC
LAVQITAPFAGLPGFNETWIRAAEGDSLAGQFFLRPIADVEAVRVACGEQLAQPRDWRALADLLETTGRRFGTAETALARLDAVAEGKAAAVVTAQQVGYLGGPFYTFVKAYHCARLAPWLERRLGRPVLPVFWLEGEDHDLEEVADAYYLDRKGEVDRVTFTPEQRIANFEVGRYVVPESVTEHIRTLAHNISARCHDEAQSLLEQCYAQRTLSEAMGRLFATLLGERGLLIVDGSDASLKRMAAPLWARILEVGPALHKLLHGRNILLSKSGLPALLSPTPSAYLFYLTGEEPVRRPISFDGTVRRADGSEESLTLDELRSRVTVHPDWLSPKAALRPLYQDFVLPTVAYVASPSEVAYHGQIQPFYSTLSVVAPSLFPRLSVTLVDEKTVDLSRNLRLELRKVLKSDVDTLMRRMLANFADGSVPDFREARGKLEEAMDSLKESLGKLDATLQGAATSTLGKMLHVLHGLERKAEKALKQKHAIELQRLRRLFAAVKPRGLLSEEGLSTAYFLLHHGPEQLMAALDEVPLDGKKHVAVSVSTASPETIAL